MVGQAQPSGRVVRRQAGHRAAQRSSTWPTPATARSRPTRVACAAGSTWPPPSWPGPPCSSSTSPPPASTPRAATTCGRSSRAWSGGGHHRPPHHPVPRGGRPPGHRTWSSSTTGTSSPRARPSELKANLGATVLEVGLDTIDDAHRTAAALRLPRVPYADWSTAPWSR